MKNGAWTPMHFARFSAVREYENHMLFRKRRRLDTSHMVSRTEFVRLLNESTTLDPFEFTQNFIKKQDSNKKRKSGHYDDDDDDDDDRFPDRGDYCNHNLNLNDPKVRARIEDKKRKVAALLKKYEMEDKEKEKAKDKEEVYDDDDRFPDRSDYYKHDLNFNDPKVRADIEYKKRKVAALLKKYEMEDKEKEKAKDKDKEMRMRTRRRSRE